MSRLSEFAAARSTRRISLTPLVDIVFILVVFFMLASSFDRRSTLEVSVPGEGAASSGQETERLDVARDGTFRLGRETVAKAELRAAIGKFAASQPQTPLIVYLEEGVALQLLVDALDAVRVAGVSKVSVVSSDAVTRP